MLWYTTLVQGIPYTLYMVVLSTMVYTTLLLPEHVMM